jgi:hypothetical protein
MERFWRCIDLVQDAFARSSDVGLVSFIAAVYGSAPLLAIYVSDLARMLGGFLLVIAAPLLLIATVCGLVAVCSSRYSRAVPTVALLIVLLAVAPYAALWILKH